MDHQTAQHAQYPVYYPQVAAPPPAVVHDGSGVTVGLGVGVGDVGEYGASGGGYGVYQGGMGQNGSNNTLDMNMRPPMPMQPIPQYQMQHQHQHQHQQHQHQHQHQHPHQHQHQHQPVQQHPTQVQPQPIPYPDAQVRHQAMYSQPIPTTSPMPPTSPYEPISPAHSYSDHSHSGTESVGHIGGGGVPTGRPAHYGHAHSLSSSSSGSSHHSIVQGHYPPMSGDNPMHYPSRGRPRRDRRHAPSTPPHMQGREIPSPTSDEDPSFAPIFSRKENTRRQRIEAEQRRRDELRDGYARLKDVLPISATKSSKVNLIERARSHILDIEKENDTLKNKVAELEREVQRLRDVSDKLMMSVAQPLQPLPSNGSPPHPTLIPGGMTAQQGQAEQDQLAYDADDGEEYLDAQTPLAGQDSDVGQYLDDGNSPVQHA